MTQETLAEGGFEPAHTHDLPYLLIAISGDRGEVRDAGWKPAGRNRLQGVRARFHGAHRTRLLPNTHALKNTGTAPIVVIDVELRNAAGATGSTNLAPGIDADRD